MRPVTEHEIGLMFWATTEPEQDIAAVRGFGLSAGQLGFPGDLPLSGLGGAWASVLAANPDFAITTAVCSYVGEDYSSFSTVRQTVGLVPRSTRSERVARTTEVADAAARLRIAAVGCHVGFIPHDREDPEYRQLCSTVREVCDHLGSHKQNFTLETGQEPAAVLLNFLQDVERTNLKINFDPANMILYGMGDPVAAVRVLGKHVVSVHCKDASSPVAKQPGSLGIECALGSGEVDFKALLSTLKEVGYRGILSIEREESDPRQRDADIRHAVGFLKHLLDRPDSRDAQCI